MKRILSVYSIPLHGPPNLGMTFLLYQQPSLHHSEQLLKKFSYIHDVNAVDVPIVWYVSLNSWRWEPSTNMHACCNKRPLVVYSSQGVAIHGTSCIFGFTKGKFKVLSNIYMHFFSYHQP